MKKITLLTLLCCLYLADYAGAGFKIGAGAGINLCKIKEKFYSDVNSRMVSFDVNIPMEIKVSKYFALQPEIHIIQKGFSLKYSGVGGIDVQYRRRNFIEIPLLFKVVYPIKDKSFVSFFTGAGFGYALTNKQITKFSDGSKEKEKFPFDTNVDDDNFAYNKIDVTIPVGFGYEYAITEKLSLYTDLRWNLDVTNNLKFKVNPSPKPSYKYRNFIFSVGIFFKAKDR